MSISRRQILQMLGAGLIVSRFQVANASGLNPGSTLKPPRLKVGDTVGLINPAGATFHPDDVVVAREVLTALGLKMKAGEHLLTVVDIWPGRTKTGHWISTGCFLTRMWRLS